MDSMQDPHEFPGAMLTALMRYLGVAEMDVAA